MLDATEIEYIRYHAWTADHDYFVQQTVLGEPWLQGDFLHFYDGETLFIPTNPLSHTRSDIRAFLEECLVTFRPKRLNCWGKELRSFEFLRNHGLQLVYEATPDPWNQELVVDFARAERQLSHRFREARREARRNRITCKHRHTGPLAADHLRLLRRFVSQMVSGLGSFDLTHFLLVPGLLATTEVGYMVEARKDDRLVGFIQGHGALGPRLAILSVCVLETELAGVSDVLYAEILRLLRECGFQACSLGNTIRKGLYCFKAKWGGEPLTAGYSQMIWQAPAVESSIHCYHWPVAIAHRYYRLLPPE